MELKNSRKQAKAPFVLTAGDPAGVGPELLLSLVGTLREAPAGVVVYNTQDSIQSALKAKAQEAGLSVTEEEPVMPGEIQVVSVSDVAQENDSRSFSRVELGKPSLDSGGLAFQALALACDRIKARGTSGLLTAPISKQYIDAYLQARGEEVHFLGHTEYLASRFGRTVMMLMHGPDFSVVPLTVHIPLRDVPEHLFRFFHHPEKLTLLARIARSAVFAGKGVALCGLNPHAGDGGVFGGEEESFMAQAIRDLDALGVTVDGPRAADALFSPKNLPKYRLVFACYHDQGLIPFKALQAQRGINATIGLPFIRTSPDHGTAFDIAGKGALDCSSMFQAFRSMINGELEAI